MNKRGFSILELAVVMSLISVLLTLVAMFFVRANGFTKDTEVYARVQSQANTCLRHITDDLYQGSNTWTEYYGDSLLFLSTQKNFAAEPTLEFDSLTGQVVWKKWVGIYHDPVEERVYRSEQALDTPGSVVLSRPLPDITLDFLKTEPGLKRRVLARHVTGFNVTGTGQSFIVEVTCQDESTVTGRLAADKLVEVTVSTEINLLN